MEEIRIWRSPLAVYDADPDAWNKPDGETTRSERVYSDSVLESIASNGFNGIWLDAHFHNMVFRPEFPEIGIYAERHQEGVRQLIRRAARFGIRIYLLMQPPRAIDDDRRDFWDHHPECAGAVDPLPSKLWGFKNKKPVIRMRSLCTSHPVVRDYLREGFADLTRLLPSLGGFIIISASEFSAHCCTRKEAPENTCRRCSAKGAAKVIATLLSDIYAGVRSVSAETRVIAWDWSWSNVTDRHEVIDGLPQGICYMSDTDRGGSKFILGKARTIDEYSLSLRGVADGFAEVCEYAMKRGLRCIPKIQCGTTHELNSVPNLPLIANLHAKALWFIGNHCGSYLGCWNFGNMPSANPAAFNFFLSHPELTDSDEAMTAFAKSYFPGCDAAGVVQGWKDFSDAMDHFPYDTPDLYRGPQSWALGFFAPPGDLTGPCGQGFRADPRGDDLAPVLEHGKFTPEEKMRGFRLVAEGWAKALPGYVKALASSSGVHAAEEIATAEVCTAAYQSADHLIRIYHLKTTCGIARAQDQYRAVCQAELAVAERVLPFVETDPRQGFNPEPNAYLFDADRIRRKIVQLKQLLHQTRTEE